jgi:hypothetical protein
MVETAGPITCGSGCFFDFWLTWLSRGPEARICIISHMRTRMLWHETHLPGPDVYLHTTTIFIQVFILIQNIRRCWDSRSKYTYNSHCGRHSTISSKLQISWVYKGMDLPLDGSVDNCFCMIIIQSLSLYSITLNNTADTVADIQWRIYSSRYIYSGWYTVAEKQQQIHGKLAMSCACARSAAYSRFALLPMQIYSSRSRYTFTAADIQK